MALFKKDSKTKDDTKNEVSKKGNDFSWVLLKPRITEKSAMLTGENIYVFNVAPRANKIQIKKAIQEKYKVTPEKVNIIVKKARKLVKRGRKVHESGEKKAIVYLKKGDAIEFA